MAAVIPPFYPDQFEQSQAVGEQDLAIHQSHVIVGILGGSDSLAAGTRVAIDTTFTTPGVVRFVAVGDTAAAFGVIKRNSKQSTFAPGDQLEVMFAGGPVVTLCANATITPGIAVTMNSGFVDVAGGGRAVMGFSLDYAIQSGLLRVVLGFAAC